MIIYSTDKPINGEVVIQFNSLFPSNSDLFLSFLVQNEKIDNTFQLSLNELNNDQFLMDSLEIPIYYNQSLTNEFCRLWFDFDHLFNLEKDLQYSLKIIIPEQVDLYEIKLNEYLPHKKLNIGLNFNPPIYQNNYDNLPFNKFLIVRNNSASYGGFWWCVHQAIHVMSVAQKYNLIPIIDYQGGLYHSNQIYDPEWVKNTRSWWDIFFWDPFSISLETRQRVLANKNLVTFLPQRQNRRRNTRTGQLKPIPDIDENSTFIFTNDSFSRFYHIVDKTTIQNLIKPLEYINDYINNFWKNNEIQKPTKAPLIGVHYRGTDKYPWGICDENKPIHYSYQKVADAIKKRMNDDNIFDYYLYVASDEAPFIDFMCSEFAGKIFWHKDLYSVRSEISTSGSQENFSCVIKDLDKLTQEEKNIVDRFKFLKQNTIHFGKKDLSNYVKAFYSLIDCLLFENCNYIFKSRGNFSDYCCNLNRNNAIIIDMNQEVGAHS